MSWWEGSWACKDLGDQHPSQREQKAQSSGGKTKYILMPRFNTLSDSVTLTPRTSGGADGAGNHSQEMRPANQPSPFPGGKKSTITMIGDNRDYEWLSIYFTGTLRQELLLQRSLFYRWAIRLRDIKSIMVTQPGKRQPSWDTNQVSATAETGPIL